MHFWYSKTAHQYEHSSRKYFALINGKKVLYTTCSYNMNPPYKALDNLYLGTGEALPYRQEYSTLGFIGV